MTPLARGRFLSLVAMVALAQGCCRTEPAPQPEPPAQVSVASISPTPPASAPAHRPTREEVLARIEENLFNRWLEDRIERDVFPKEPYRVDYFNDDGLGRVAGSYWVQRVWVDLDRDGRWDEKWDRKLVKGKLVTTRRLSPADDERFSEVWIDHDDGQWRRADGGG